MTSTGLPPGSAVPIQLAPNLDPADAAHVPRWLDELRSVGLKASLGLTTGEIRDAMVRGNDYAAGLTGLRLAGWQGERGGG